MAAFSFCSHIIDPEKAQPVWMTYRPAHDSGKRANLRGHVADLDTTHTLFITDIDRARLSVRKEKDMQTDFPLQAKLLNYLFRFSPLPEF